VFRRLGYPTVNLNPR